MPFMYTDRLATAGNLTTSGTANTETETLFLKPGTTRSLYVSGAQITGKGAAATSLSSIVARMIFWGTASTAGTGLAIIAKDKLAGPATTITGASRPTSGTTRTEAGPILSCGIASPGTPWVALNQDEMISLAASNAGSISLMDAATSASMPFEFGMHHQEW